MCSQTTRAAASVPANSEEGHGRQGPRKFANSLSIARGSLAELDTFLELGGRLGYFDAPQLAPANSLADEVGKVITALRRRLATR